MSGTLSDIDDTAPGVGTVLVVVVALMSAAVWVVGAVTVWAWLLGILR